MTDEARVGAKVRLAGSTVLPFNGEVGYVTAHVKDRLMVSVTLKNGERRVIAVRPLDVVVVTPSPSTPPRTD